MITILTLLAVARVTRFITTDALFDGPRVRVLTMLMNQGRFRTLRDKVAYLIVCDWCSSVYVGAAAAGAYAAWHGTMAYEITVMALSASYITGLLTSVTERGE